MLDRKDVRDSDGQDILVMDQHALGLGCKQGAIQPHYCRGLHCGRAGRYRSGRECWIGKRGTRLTMQDEVDGQGFGFDLLFGPVGEAAVLVGFASHDISQHQVADLRSCSIIPCLAFHLGAICGVLLTDERNREAGRL